MTTHDEIPKPERHNADDRREAAKRLQQDQLRSIRQQQADEKPPLWTERLGRHFVRQGGPRS